MRIVVLDGHTLNPGDNPWDSIRALGELTVYDRTASEQIIARAKEADILLTNKTPLSAATIEALPNCKFISVLATGYNVVDIRAAAQKGIPVSNVPIYGTDSVSHSHAPLDRAHFPHPYVRGIGIMLSVVNIDKAGQLT